MNRFTDRHGVVVECERYMDGPKHAIGYWWWSTGHKEYTEVPVQTIADDSKLFGYDKDEFMRKQYR